MFSLLTQHSRRAFSTNSMKTQPLLTNAARATGSMSSSNFTKLSQRFRMFSDSSAHTKAGEEAQKKILERNFNKLSGMESIAAANQSTNSTEKQEPTIKRGLLNAHEAITSQIAKKGLVFEFSLGFIAVSVKEFGVGLVRTLWYTFRPILMLFGFGYVFKFIFLLSGAPVLMSFYSLWLFESFYSIAQCVLSVIFLTQLCYMDMSFRGRLRPMTKLAIRRCQEALKRAKNTIC